MAESNKAQIEQNPGGFIESKIKDFVLNSPDSRLGFMNNEMMYDEPLVRFADGDDAIFTEYKTIIGPGHMTPREALAIYLNKPQNELPARLSVISWILPISEAVRGANRAETKTPSRLWSHTRWYGEKLNEKLGAYMAKALTDAGYMAVNPLLQPYFKMISNEKGPFSNWSERHIAYAAGHGTFSLSDGFITERGIAHRCSSVVTDLELPINPRTATGPFSNCLAYAGVECKACINRCPAGAITEKGHNKVLCLSHMRSLGYNPAEFAKNGYKNDTSVAGCGFCQTKVPCEHENPTRKLKKQPAKS